MTKPKVLSVSSSPTHTMSKPKQKSITLLKKLGVEHDAHQGKKVKHRSRVARDPNQPNLRQVHLIHFELLEELALNGFQIQPGQMGENITTKGIALLDLPKDTILKIGKTAEIQITGLRNPCHQLNGIQEGLMAAVLDKEEDGQLIRKAGIMGIVLEGGEILPGDLIEFFYPDRPYGKLDVV